LPLPSKYGQTKEGYFRINRNKPLAHKYNGLLKTAHVFYLIDEENRDNDAQFHRRFADLVLDIKPLFIIAIPLFFSFFAGLIADAGNRR